MNYRTIGKTGLKVSEISLGSWLTYGQTIDKEHSQSIIETAYDSGINMFDCTDTLPLRDAERIMGEILNRYSRESYILSTQAFFSMNSLPNNQTLSRKYLHSEINNSLKRLNTEYIDIFYCHRIEGEVNLYEIFRTIDDFIRQGKILYVGISEWTAVQIIEILKIQDQYLLDKLVVNHSKYNLLSREIENEIIPTCVNQDLGIIAYSPLAQGFLSGKYRKGREIAKDSRGANEQINGYMNGYLTSENFDMIEKFIQFAEKKECTASQLALSWILSKKSIASLLIGATKINQIEENIKVSDIKLSEEDLLTIENIFTKNIDKR